MAEYKSDFNLAQALNGSSVGYKVGSTYYEACNFRRDTSNITDYPFCIDVTNIVYGVDSLGNVYDTNGNLKWQLIMIQSTINKTQGTIGTRVDDTGTSTFSVNTLQPREEVAMRCLEAIIAHEPLPLSYDNTKIKMMVDKSFLLAQEFINQAINYRKNEASTGGSESKDPIKVDPTQLSSDTDKLLYNIATAITNQSAQEKTQFELTKNDGIKIVVPNEINTKVRIPDTVNTKVSGEMTITGFPAPKVEVTVPVPSVTVNNNIPSSGGDTGGTT